MSTSADFIEDSNVSIGHLGIVASAFDTSGITGVIDVPSPKRGITISPLIPWTDSSGM